MLGLSGFLSPLEGLFVNCNNQFFNCVDRQVGEALIIESVAELVETVNAEEERGFADFVPVLFAEKLQKVSNIDVGVDDFLEAHKFKI